MADITVGFEEFNINNVVFENLGSIEMYSKNKNIIIKFDGANGISDLTINEQNLIKSYIKSYLASIYNLNENQIVIILKNGSLIIDITLYYDNLNNFNNKQFLNIVSNISAFVIENVNSVNLKLTGIFIDDLFNLLYNSYEKINNNINLDLYFTEILGKNNKYLFRINKTQIINIQNKCPGNNIVLSVNKKIDIFNDNTLFNVIYVKFYYINLTNGKKGSCVDFINDKWFINIETHEVETDNKICIKQFEIYVKPYCLTSKSIVLKYTDIGDLYIRT